MYILPTPANDDPVRSFGGNLARPKNSDLASFLATVVLLDICPVAMANALYADPDAMTTIAKEQHSHHR